MPVPVPVMRQAAIEAGALDVLRVVCSVQAAVLGRRNLKEVLAELKRNQPALFRTEQPSEVGEVNGVPVYYDPQLKYEFYYYLGHKYPIFSAADEIGMSLAIAADFDPFGIQFSIYGQEEVLLITNPRNGWRNVVKDETPKGFRTAVRALGLPRSIRKQLWESKRA